MRKDGVQRQLDMAANSAKDWPQHKRDEARTIFMSLGEPTDALLEEQDESQLEVKE